MSEPTTWQVTPGLLCPVCGDPTTLVVADPAPRAQPCGHLVAVTINDDNVVYYLDPAE